MKKDLYEFRQEVYEHILDTLGGLSEQYTDTVKLSPREKKCAMVAIRSVQRYIELKLKNKQIENPPF